MPVTPPVESLPVPVAESEISARLRDLATRPC
jgi:hypothetical protein